MSCPYGLSEDITAYSTVRHQTYQAVWTDRTAHPDFRPLPPDMPVSYGQCVPSSCLLHDELAERYPREQFVLNSGRILLYDYASAAEEAEIPTPRLRTVMEAHVWITWIRNRLDEDMVIDVTADQIPRLSPVIVSKNDDLVRECGYIYHGYRAFNSSEELIKKFEEKEPALRQRIQYLNMAVEEADRFALKDSLKRDAHS